MKNNAKKLSQILKNISHVEVIESENKKERRKEIEEIKLSSKEIEKREELGEDLLLIENLLLDSREIKCSKDAFFATQGVNIDRKDFISEVIENGCKYIFCSEIPKDIKKEMSLKKNAKKYEGVTFVLVKDLEQKVGLIVENFYDNPSEKIKVIGITGTNGKTTIAYSLHDILRKMNQKVALFSTIENIIDGEKKEAINTTPDPITISKNLKEAVDKKCSFLVMEVSSHASEQGRISGINFDGAVFTNFSQDHLRFHKTMENYFQAKKKFFDNLKEEAIIVSNLDDERGGEIIKDSKARKFSYASFDKDFARNHKAEDIVNNYFFKNEHLRDSKTVVSFTTKKNDRKIRLNTLGTFNVYNMLAVFTLLAELGFDNNLIVKIIETIDPPKGRMQIVAKENKKEVLALVDYAHTPDALENILKTIREAMPAGKIHLVVGAGGDRDKTKRPLMGKVSVDLADKVYFTSDNPRTEKPASILKDIVSNLDPKKDNFEVIEKRAEAIKKASKDAKKGDILIVAGKGHEEYQIIGTKKNHFSDKEELEKNLL